MQIEIVRIPTAENWFDVKNLALNTIGKETTKIPNNDWKKMILISEHSPIRNLIYSWKWIDIPYWISVHIVRHKIGIEHFVESQRNDRQDNYDRRKAPQDALVNHTCVANAQAIMNISHKRMCFQASTETRNAWKMLVNKLETVDNNLYQLCVPTCVYRNGLCPEPKCCEYNETTQFLDRLKQYKDFIQRKE